MEMSNNSSGCEQGINPKNKESNNINGTCSILSSTAKACSISDTLDSDSDQSGIFLLYFSHQVENCHSASTIHPLIPQSVQMRSDLKLSFKFFLVFHFAG